MRIYGLQSDGNKDNKTLEQERINNLKAKYQLKDNYHSSLRLTKTFTHNLRRYIAYAIQNKIFISCADTFKVVDVLSSPDHASPIHCFDIAEVSKDIVSFSDEGKSGMSLVVFGLSDDSYLNGIDSRVTQTMTDATKGGNNFLPKSQHLKWKQYWKCDQ